MSMRGHWFVAVLVGVVGLLAACGSSSDNEVTGPLLLTDASNFDAEVGFSDDGRAMAVWQRAQGPGSGTFFSVQASVDGDENEPSELHDANPWNPRLAHIATNARGDAVAAWTIRERQRLIVQASYRDGSGRWEEAQTLSLAGNGLLDPAVGIGPDGRAVVAWRDFEEGTMAAVREPDSGWADPETVQPLTPGSPWPGSSVSVAVGPDRVAIGWVPFDAAKNSLGSAVVAVEDGAGWSVSRSLGEGLELRRRDTAFSASEPELAFLRDGTLVAAWELKTLTTTGKEIEGLVEVAERSPGGVWSPTRGISGGDRVSSVRLASDGERTIVGWIARTGSDGKVLISERSGEETWTDPIDVSLPGPDGFVADGRGLRLVLAEGRAAAAWWTHSLEAPRPLSPSRPWWRLLVAHEEDEGMWASPLSLLDREGHQRIAGFAATPSHVELATEFAPSTRGRLIGSLELRRIRTSP